MTTLPSPNRDASASKRISSDADGLAVLRFSDVREECRVIVGEMVNGNMRTSALWETFTLGGHSARRLALLELLEDPDYKLRIGAAWLGLYQGYPDPRIAKVFAATLSDDVREVRVLAAGYLSFGVRPPRETVPFLAMLLRSSDAVEKVLAAAAALRAVCNADADNGEDVESCSLHELFQVLRSALRGDDLVLATIAAVNLIGHGTERDKLMKKTAIETLVRLFRTDDAGLQAFTLKMLEECGPAVGELTSLLVGLVNDVRQDAVVRAAAVRTLGKIGAGGDAGDAVVTSMVRARTEDWQLAIATAAALRDLGEFPRAGIVKLLDVLENGEPLQRAAAALALGGVKTSSHEIIASLTRRLKTESQMEILEALIHSLARFGVSAVPTMISCLKERDVRMAPLIGGVLTMIGGSAVSEIVRALLTTDDVYFRVCAAKLLCQIGREAAAAVPELVQLIEKGDPASRGAAFEALRAIKQDARPAIPAMIDVLLNGTINDQAWAEAVLVSIGVDSIPELEAARARSNAAAQQRIVAVLGRLGFSNQRPADPCAAMRTPSLARFVTVGRIWLARGPVSYKALAEELEIKDNTLRATVSTLERILREQTGREIKLVKTMWGKHGTELTDEGKTFLADAEQSLAKRLTPSSGKTKSVGSNKK